ncbi:hypothetical protein, conserved [Babesia bigemina]|uniref:Uncharacterized protein n=1 Tax=Babesia bigemina TaxID=5866 RepID=A0A061D7Y7_BABBI|nr:hypothetical protein, conserved [Babesia bigemina]CDR96117.1 hypothetical protein, conserved [Babesia bigemina]|eukprot:XP_012768303.1 hypothetical protein, conserved [Babesia bigemina]
MVWEAVEVKLPTEVTDMMALDARQRAAYTPNVQVKNFSNNERTRVGEQNSLIPEGQLHDLMKNNVSWLMDLFSQSPVHLDTTYGAPRVKIHSPTCYMFGLKSKYMPSGKLQELDVRSRKAAPDAALAATVTAIFESEVKYIDPSSINKPVKEAANGRKVGRTSRDVDGCAGIEVSDEDACGDNECSSVVDSEHANRGTKDTTKSQIGVAVKDVPPASADGRSADGHEALLNHMRFVCHFLVYMAQITLCRIGVCSEVRGHYFA